GTVGLPSAVEQVMLQLSRSVKGGQDRMMLQLQPADLGRINIKLDFLGDGKVQGTVLASNPATLDLLLKDVRSLERALQDAGLRADPGSLQFSLGEQQGDQAGRTGQQTLRERFGGKETQDTTSPASLGWDSVENWYLTPGRVNFKV